MSGCLVREPMVTNECIPTQLVANHAQGWGCLEMIRRNDAASKPLHRSRQLILSSEPRKQV